MPTARYPIAAGFPLLAGLLLAGCSVATPPAITMGTRPAEPVSAVRLELAPPADETANRFAASLAAALPRHGVAVAADSPLVMTLALSQRPAAMGVAQRPGETWISPPRRRGPLDACRAQRLSVRMVARHETAAEPTFAAGGGFDYCRLDQADLDALADQFAAAVAQR